MYSQLFALLGIGFIQHENYTRKLKSEIDEKIVNIKNTVLLLELVNEAKRIERWTWGKSARNNRVGIRGI